MKPRKTESTRNCVRRKLNEGEKRIDDKGVPMVFKGEAPKIRLHLTREDVLGQRGSAMSENALSQRGSAL